MRGGPALRTPGNWNSWFVVSSDDRKKFVAELMASSSYGDDNYRNSKHIGLEFEYRPLNFLQISIEPSYSVSSSNVIFIDMFDNDNSDKTYVVSSIDQEFVNLDIRINIGITPDLSIQYWGQPFLFSGDYYHFMKVTDPMASKWQDQYTPFTSSQITYNSESDQYSIADGNNTYEFENPDFSFFEYRSNFVVRWEYIPGSTAYLVWSQGRTGDHPDGRFSLSDNINRLIDLTPHNGRLFQALLI